MYCELLVPPFALRRLSYSCCHELNNSWTVESSQSGCHHYSRKADKARVSVQQISTLPPGQLQNEFHGTRALTVYR